MYSDPLNLSPTKMSIKYASDLHKKIQIRHKTEHLFFVLMLPTRFIPKIIIFFNEYGHCKLFAPKKCKFSKIPLIGFEINLVDIVKSKLLKKRDYKIEKHLPH